MKIDLSKKNSERGIALVIVMLVIISLGVFVASFAFSMKVEVRLAANTTRDSDMEWLGRSGLELARFVLAEKLKIPIEGQFDALNQMWAGGPFGTNEVLMSVSLLDVPLGDGQVSVHIRDLESKININIADPPLLQNTMQIMGIDPFVSGEIVDSILDWMDADSNPRLNGTEDEDYVLSPNPPFPPYRCKNGAIDHISELLLIRGIDPSLYYGVNVSPASDHLQSQDHFQNQNHLHDRDHFQNQNQSLSNVGFRDVFTSIGGGRVNINTASSVVLSMIPGLNQTIANDIVLFRRGFDGLDGTEDDLPFLRIEDLGNLSGMPPEMISLLSRYLTVRSSTFEVKIEARLGDYQKVYLATLIRLGSRNVVVLHFYPIA